MKIIPSPRAGQQGNVLLLTIVVMSLISFLLVTYLTLVQSQNTAIMRSQAWNGAMPIIEAGIEDALSHVNAHGATNLACDGWVHDTFNNTYTMTRYIGNNFYVVTITNYIMGSSNNVPYIDSKAYVVMPAVLASSGQGPFLAQANAPVQKLTFLGRGVRVSTGRDRVFVKGIVARDNIDLQGNNVRTDSFDSSDPAWSTNGIYIPGRYKDNGDIAVNGSIINVANANVNGRASTGPGGSISLGPNGAVGSVSWNQTSRGIQPGWTSSDMNVAFPPVVFPYSGGLAPSGDWITNVVATTVVTNVGASSTTIEYPLSAVGVVTTNYPIISAVFPTNSPGPVTSFQITNTVPASTRTYPAAGTFLGGVTSNNVTTGKVENRGWYYNYDFITGYTTNWVHPTFTYIAPSTYQTNHITERTWYDYVLNGGDYALTTLRGSVYVRRTSRLTVSTTLELSGVVITPEQRLDLYSSAAETRLSGNNTANSDGRATSFFIWGTPSVTSMVLDGNAGLTAAYYAPNATLTMNGSGSTVYDFTGAAVVGSVRMNGHFNFHYDEALGKFGPDRGWYVTQWNEIEPNRIPKAVMQENGSITFQSAGGTTATVGSAGGTGDTATLNK